MSELEAPCAIGLDVGGSALKAGVVSAGGRLLGEAHERAIASQGSREAILDDFAAILEPLLVVGPGPRGIGVGMPGPFDYERGISLMRGLTKFDAIHGLDLRRALRARLSLPDGFPIVFVNDAAAFALGEIRYGAGAGHDRVMVLTLGTGCGSAFAVRGQLLREGERVPPEGYVYAIPYRGSIVDDHLSSRGIASLWRELSGRTGEAPSVRDLACAARDGDETARRVFATFGACLVEALGGVLDAFRPDVLILGGQVSRSFDLFADSIASALSGRVQAPQVRPAAHLSTSAILGAASLVL